MYRSWRLIWFAKYLSCITLIWVWILISDLGFGFGFLIWICFRIWIKDNDVCVSLNSPMPNTYMLILIDFVVWFEILIIDGNLNSPTYCYIEYYLWVCFKVICCIIIFEFPFGRVMFDRCHRPSIELYWFWNLKLPPLWI